MFVTERKTVLKEMMKESSHLTTAVTTSIFTARPAVEDCQDGSDESQEEYLGCNLNPKYTELSSLAVRGERLVRSTDQERFFWENDYVGKPVNFYHGAAYQIPVIEGETVEIKCKVRAVSEDPYTIIWDYENFNANTSGKTVLVNNTDGDEYAQDTITVNIDRPADIDDKDIICSWENGKFSDTIGLQFKVYVFDNSENSQHCDKCVHGAQIKLIDRDSKKEKTTTWSRRSNRN